MRKNEKKKLITQFFELVPSHGFNETTLVQANEAAGFALHYHEILLPEGVTYLAEYYTAQISEKIEKKYQGKLAALSIRDRIFTLIAARIDILAKEKETATALLRFLSMPNHAFLTAKLLWKTADHLWCLAGDNSTDFNFYTKRSLASAIYSSTLLYFTTDTSKGHKDTKAFLRRRIEDVMVIQKVKTKFKDIRS